MNKTSNIQEHELILIEQAFKCHEYAKHPILRKSPYLLPSGGSLEDLGKDLKTSFLATAVSLLSTSSFKLKPKLLNLMMMMKALFYG